MRETTEFGRYEVVPEVGDTIYVPTSLYIDHGEDDVVGGLATVTNVISGISAGRPTPFISVKEHPGNGYNWHMLKDRQEELKTRFGNEYAYPDPDFGGTPEFW